jgi:hypothetical protein
MLKLTKIKKKRNYLFFKISKFLQVTNFMATYKKCNTPWRTICINPKTNHM